MANGTALVKGGATPLGYGAAVLPGSTFDPTAFGQQVAALEFEKAKTAKQKAQQDLDASLESMNPELGKLKWTAPYLNEYQNRIENFRTRNIDWYRKQNGRLTPSQIAENQIFKEKTKAEFDLLNQAYDDFLTARDKVLTDPDYATPENIEKIKKYSNPYEFDKEGVKKAGGILEYIATNPLDIQPKVEPLDVTGIIQKIKTLAGTEENLQQPYIDPITGNFVYPTIEEGNINAALEIAKQEYANNPPLQTAYPVMNDWLTAVSESMQGQSRTGRIMAAPKDSKGLTITIGDATVTGDLKVAQDKKDLNLDVTRNVLEKSPVAALPGDMSKIEIEKTIKEAIPTDGYVIADKNNKPITISGVVNSIGSLTSSGIQDSPGGNINITVSSVREFPQMNQSLDLKAIPVLDEARKNAKAILEQRAENGILPENILLTQKELRALRNLGFGDAVTDTPYVMGDIKNLKEIIDSQGVYNYKKALSKSYIVPYSDLQAQLQNAGFSLGGAPQRPAGYQGYRIQDPESGQIWQWNDSTSSYELSE